MQLLLLLLVVVRVVEEVSNKHMQWHSLKRTIREFCVALNSNNNDLETWVAV